MRILLLGSGEFGIPTFEWLRQNHEVVGLVSQPDRLAGRRRHLTPTPSAQWATHHGIPILKSDNVNAPEFVAQIKAFDAQVGVVIAFGQKLSPELIAAAGRDLVVNLHSSLLPKLRGAAPINWAILSGETQTGVSVISLAQQMDAGLVYATRAIDISPLETAGELHDRLANLGPSAMAQVIEDLVHHRLHGSPQDATQVSHARKLSKEDGKLDFSLSAEALRRKIHGLTPWPGVSVSWFRQETETPETIFLRRVAVVETAQQTGSADAHGRVLADGSIACGQGAIRILELQLAGKRVMPLEEFVRGHPIRPGDFFE